MRTRKAYTVEAFDGRYRVIGVYTCPDMAHQAEDAMTLETIRLWEKYKDHKAWKASGERHAYDPLFVWNGNDDCTLYSVEEHPFVCKPWVHWLLGLLPEITIRWRFLRKPWVPF